MTCIVCKEAHKYKCVQCSAGYCSVACYKTHKVECRAEPETTDPIAPETMDPKTTQVVCIPEFENWLEDPNLRALIAQPALQHHLMVIANIIHDQSLSGESTSEGRRAVAIKKLRELRMGGREQNQAVEEFVRMVLEHMQLSEAEN